MRGGLAAARAGPLEGTGWGAEVLFAPDLPPAGVAGILDFDGFAPFIARAVFLIFAPIPLVTFFAGLAPPPPDLPTARFAAPAVTAPAVTAPGVETRLPTGSARSACASTSDT